MHDALVIAQSGEMMFALHRRVESLLITSESPPNSPASRFVVFDPHTKKIECVNCNPVEIFISRTYHILDIQFQQHHHHMTRRIQNHLMTCLVQQDIFHPCCLNLHYSSSQ